MAAGKILIVDDDRAVREALQMAFRREKYEVTEAESGSQAISLAGRSHFDLIILDVMMQDMDGYEVLQKLRYSGNVTPILMLSGKTEETDQVLGLGMGADDYVTKPFHAAVLMQKVKALIRRNSVYSRESGTTISYGPFRFDSVKLECTKNDVPIYFTARELMLFRFFMEHPGQAFTKGQLYNQVWGNSVVDDNTIMVYINRIREKIEDDPKKPVYLLTKRGVGYVFKDADH